MTGNSGGMCFGGKSASSTEPLEDYSLEKEHIQKTDITIVWGKVHFNKRQNLDWLQYVIVFWCVFLLFASERHYLQDRSVLFEIIDLLQGSIIL